MNKPRVIVSLKYIIVEDGEIITADAARGAVWDSSRVYKNKINKKIIYIIMVHLMIL